MLILCIFSSIDKNPESNDYERFEVFDSISIGQKNVIVYFQRLTLIVWISSKMICLGNDDSHVSCGFERNRLRNDAVLSNKLNEIPLIKEQASRGACTLWIISDDAKHIRTVLLISEVIHAIMNSHVPAGSNLRGFWIISSSFRARSLRLNSETYLLKERQKFHKACCCSSLRFNYYTL